MKEKAKSLRYVNAMYWIVDNLVPKTVKYFCAMRVLAVASTEKFAHKEMDTIGGFEAIEYYADKHSL